MKTTCLAPVNCRTSPAAWPPGWCVSGLTWIPWWSTAASRPWDTTACGSDLTTFASSKTTPTSGTCGLHPDVLSLAPGLFCLSGLLVWLVLLWSELWLCRIGLSWIIINVMKRHSLLTPCYFHTHSFSNTQRHRDCKTWSCDGHSRCYYIYKMQIIIHIININFWSWPWRFYLKRKIQMTSAGFVQMPTTFH